jgi:glycolate oxidase
MPNGSGWKRPSTTFSIEALKMGGTLSGEHGTGLAKSRYLEKETSAGTILFSSRIKRAMDPNNILNPGKIIAAKA